MAKTTTAVTAPRTTKVATKKPQAEKITQAEKAPMGTILDLPLRGQVKAIQKISSELSELAQNEDFKTRMINFAKQDTLPAIPVNATDEEVKEIMTAHKKKKETLLSFIFGLLDAHYDTLITIIAVLFNTTVEELESKYDILSLAVEVVGNPRFFSLLTTVTTLQNMLNNVTYIKPKTK